MSRAATDAERPPTRPANTRGPVLAIGGAEDKVDDKIILSTFAQLAGGAAAQIIVIPTASALEDTGERYRTLFLAMGVGRAEVLVIDGREDANDLAVAAALDDTTGIFLTGGNQMRLSSLVGGTAVARAVRRRNEAGAIVAGTSAGASILSSRVRTYTLWG